MLAGDHHVPIDDEQQQTRRRSIIFDEGQTRSMRYRTVACSSYQEEFAPAQGNQLCADR